MQGRKSNPDEGYDLAEFAAKYGLSLKSAEVVLTINGPSKERCDAAAKAFKDAVTQRREKRLSDRLKLE